ncbi:Protein-lysine N-methyltransferase [Arachis hypogaea]|nr:Protein-lysine N-methyltransferase [Arachis hypogaea]
MSFSIVLNLFAVISVVMLHRSYAETAKIVAEEVLKLCNGSVISPVACIACPTLYAYHKNMDPNVPAQLFEYDKCFEQYGCDYTFYDYNHPEELPLELKHSFNIVMADPPYLNMDPNVPAKLFEYDKRFEQYGCDYTFYDYNHPEELPLELKYSFKIVVADPPYLDNSSFVEKLCLLEAGLFTAVTAPFS